MRVVCENCGATYKIPESKLVKEVNKATCRKCGFRMMIRRPAAAIAEAAASPVPGDAATQVTAPPPPSGASEPDILKAHTRIEEPKIISPPPENEWSDEAPTQARADPFAEAQVKPQASPKSAPQPIKKPAAKKPRKPASKDSEGKAPADMVLALCATFAAAAGPMLLATNTGDGDMQRMAGLFAGLLGSLTCLFLLVTGNLWRQKGNVPISVALATVLSMGGTAFVEVAIHDGGGATSVAKKTASTPSPETPAPSKSDTETSVDALAEKLGADDEEPKGEAATEKASEAKGEAEGDAVADAADAPPAPKTAADASSSERGAAVPTEEDEEALGDPDFDDIPPASTRSHAEERRRREMEDAAARAKAEREARDQERERSRRSKRERRTKAAAAPASEAPSKMKSLPLTVVDTMIKTNLTVKRCFFAEKKATGSLPSRVNVYFTVMPTGKVPSARVTTAEYKGTTLDSCLGRAFKGIRFPAFEGEPLSMTYPFIL